MTTPDTAGGWEWSGGGIASISKSLNDFGKGGVQVLSQLIYAVHAEESWTKYLTPAEPEDLNQQVLQSWKDPPPVEWRRLGPPTVSLLQFYSPREASRLRWQMQLQLPQHPTEPPRKSALVNPKSFRYSFPGWGPNPVGLCKSAGQRSRTCIFCQHSACLVHTSLNWWHLIGFLNGSKEGPHLPNPPGCQEGDIFSASAPGWLFPPGLPTYSTK